MNWHSLYPEEIFKVLDARPDGFVSQEIGERQKRFGQNEIQEVRRKGFFKIFLRQFTGIFILILCAAGFVSLVLGGVTDALFIFIVVGLNACFGFFQEYRADRTFQFLKTSLEETAVVLRDRQEQEIPRRDVVPGDVVVVERGKKIPADCRILESHHLLVNESALTGEWLPVKKEAGVLPEPTALSDRTNMLFMGTVVEDGFGKSIVTATGKDTEFGKIGGWVQAASDLHTPLEKSVARLSGLFGIIISVVLVAVFLVGILSGIAPLEMFLSSVALAVAAVPEGLAITLTIILAIGMRRILEKKGLVRQLFAAETLGSVSVVATDKTGTITEARMQVSHILTGTRELLRDGARIAGISRSDGEESHLLALKFAAASSEAVIENPDAELEEYRIRGRPTDRALTEAALEAGIRKSDLARRGEILDSLPFDETRKFSAALFRGEKKNTVALVGAPEFLLLHSTELHIDGVTASLKSDYFRKISSRYEELVRLGLRVVGVAHKSTSMTHIDPGDSKILSGLIFVGFIALRDPVRKEVAESIALAREAKIKTVIITGDHAFTASAVAADVGIEIPESAVLVGSDLEGLNDANLKEKVRDVLLFARVSPAHKVRIVEAYQASGEVIAMVGDGINDAPALRRADIGIALGSGTDIAKEAADLVLLENGFTTIIAAIREGRIILENLRKTLAFLLMGGFTEIAVVGLSLFFHLPLPLLPAQILWINLVGDGLPALAFAFERGNDALMREPPEKHIRLLRLPLVLLVSFFGVLVSAASFLLFWWFHGNGTIEHARTITFALIGANSLFFIFGVKHLRRPIFTGSFFDNRVMVVAVCAGLLLLFAAVHTPFLRGILHTVPLAFTDWLLVFGFGIINILTAEILKYFFVPRATPFSSAS